MLPQAIEVLDGWGFVFVTSGTGIKRGTSGRLAMGPGYVLRNAAEMFLIGRRGQPRTASHRIRNVIEAPRRERSRKPDEAYAAAEALFGPGRRADVFACERHRHAAGLRFGDCRRRGRGDLRRQLRASDLDALRAGRIRAQLRADRRSAGASAPHRRAVFHGAWLVGRPGAQHWLPRRHLSAAPRRPPTGTRCRKPCRAIVERLRGVIIEQRPAADLLARYDRPDTLFYVDPPYLFSTRSTKRVGNDLCHGYRHELDDAGHEALLDQLAAMRGMVVLSGYPSPLYDAKLMG
jgi:hypothetical protein